MKRLRGWTSSCTTKVDTTSRLVLYGTSACHLCEQALALVQASLPQNWILEEVDISDSEELFERYGTTIPVVKVEHSARELNWPFTGQQVSALLAEEVGQGEGGD